MFSLLLVKVKPGPSLKDIAPLTSNALLGSVFPIPTCECTLEKKVKNKIKLTIPILSIYLYFISREIQLLCVVVGYPLFQQFLWLYNFWIYISLRGKIFKLHLRFLNFGCYN